MTLPYGLLNTPRDERLLGAERLPTPNIPRSTLTIPFPNAQQGPSLFNRAKEFLMPTPDALMGLLSPEDVGQSRGRGLLGMGLSLLSSGGAPLPLRIAQALGAGRGGFEEAIANTTKMQQFAQQQKQAQQLRQARATIAQKYPPKPNETAVQTLERVQRMLPEFININDTEMVGKLVELLKSQGDLLKPTNPTAMDVRVQDNVLGDDGKPYQVFYDNDTGKELRRVPQFVKKDGGLTEGQANAENQRKFQREKDLGRDYSAMAKQFGPVAEYYANAQASKAQALAGDPIAQHSLIFNYMHVLEPSSIVREGEYAAVARRNGVSERVSILLEKYKRGTFMPPNMVKSIEAEIERIVAAKQPLLKNRMTQFRSRAERWGVNADDIIYDPFVKIGQSDEGSDSTATKPDVRDFLKR